MTLSPLSLETVSLDSEARASGDLPIQPYRSDATAKVGAQVRGIVFHIRLPGGRDDLGGQVHIILLLRRVALNVEDELLSRLRVLQLPLFPHHGCELRVIDMAAVARLVWRIWAV